MDTEMETGQTKEQWIKRDERGDCSEQRGRQENTVHIAVTGRIYDNELFVPKGAQHERTIQ